MIIHLLTNCNFLRTSFQVDEYDMCNSWHGKKQTNKLSITMFYCLLLFWSKDPTVARRKWREFSLFCVDACVIMHTTLHMVCSCNHKHFRSNQERCCMSLQILWWNRSEAEADLHWGITEVNFLKWIPLPINSHHHRHHHHHHHHHCPNVSLECFSVLLVLLSSNVYRRHRQYVNCNLCLSWILNGEEALMVKINPSD